MHVGGGFLVGENPQIPELFGETARLVEIVAVGDTDERDQALPVRPDSADHPTIDPHRSR